MRKRGLLFAALFLLNFSHSVFSENIIPYYPPAPAEKKYDEGEILRYQIYYLGLPVGESVSEIKSAAWKNREVYQLQVKVRSYKVIDLIYKVRDEHVSYIDKETLETLQYEKKIREGRRRSYEKLVFDPENRKVEHYDEQGKILQTLETFPKAQDQLSCGYFARTLDFKKEESFTIPVHAEAKNWNLEVKIHEQSEITLPKIGKFEAVRIEPLMEFTGIFFRKGKVEGWVSLDKRRIPLKMKVQIPVLGSVTSELASYTPGKKSS